MPEDPPNAPMPKWTLSGVGPRQNKRFADAWQKLAWEGASKRSFTGGYETTSTQLMLRPDDPGFRPSVRSAMMAFGKRYGWQITRQDVNSMIALAESLAVELERTRPWFAERDRLEFEAHEAKRATVAA